MQHGKCDIVFPNGSKYDGDYCEFVSTQRKAHTFTKYQVNSK
jgi:hypothetical protein